MRETVGSLKTYFIIVGTVSLALNLLTFTLGLNALGIVLTVIGIAISSAFLYVGIRMREMLVENPARIQQLLYANVALALVGLALDLSVGSTRGLVRVAIVLAISTYLLSSVKRLASELATQAVPAPQQTS